MNIKIALFVFTLFINSSAWSAEKKAVPSAEPTLAAGVEKTKAKTQSEAEKLYQRYQRLYGKMILAVACVQNPKCIQPEDEVIKYNMAIIRVTDRLDELVIKQKDLDASYYRGLIAYERGKYYVGRATLITDPDFILSATVFRRYALDQFRLAEKNLAINAASKNPDACKHLGEIADLGYLGIKNKDKATDYYYCAAMGYLDIGKKNAAADMYNAMRNSAIHNDPRTVEVYARLHNNDTVSNMRKSVSQTSRLDSETSKISRQ
jgi:hypothetical protein